MSKLCKQSIAASLILALLFSFFAGIPGAVKVKAADTPPTKIENAKVTLFGCESPFPFSFDFADLADGDNTVYSKSVSVFAALMAEDVSIEKQHPQIIVNGQSGRFMEQMGFTDIQRIVLDSNDYTLDKDDLSVVYIGRLPMMIHGREVVFYAAGIVDSYSKMEYWRSNVDIGAEEQEYSDVTGQHDESWNKKNTKGFDVTANRIYDKIEDYLKGYAAQDAGKEKVLLCTGHSRGAAIANLVGKKYEDKTDGSIKPFTYTYAAPYTTTVDEVTAKEYKTIFNVINANDLVANIPPTDVEEWDFRRYGTDKIVDIDDDETLVSEWNQYIGPMVKQDIILNLENEDNEQSMNEAIKDQMRQNALNLLNQLSEAVQTETDLSIDDDLRRQLQDCKILSSKHIGEIEYVSAEGAAVPELLGDLFISRKGLYTKDVSTALSLKGITTEEGFKQKMDDLGLSSYYTFIGKDEDDMENNTFLVKVCPAIFVKSVFSVIGMEEMNLDYVSILIRGILNAENYEYPLTVIKALLYSPALINGVRPCHTAQTYYFLANKIALSEDKPTEKPETDSPHEITAKQNSNSNVKTGIDQQSPITAEIGSIALLIFAAGALLYVRRRNH